jgi:DNA-binding CsgD family transcriptional regulator
MKSVSNPQIDPPYTTTGLDRAITVYVVADDGVSAGVVMHALEREGLQASITWGTLADIGGGRFDLVVVVEPEETPYPDETFASLRKGRSVNLLIVVCSPERTRAETLLWGGVDGIIVEPGADAAIGPIVRAGLAGYLVVPRSLRVALEPPPLSARERQMLALVIEGLTNREIADRLYLAESTVKRHLSSTFRRLGVSSRREAAAAVLSAEHGLGLAQRERP